MWVSCRHAVGGSGRKLVIRVKVWAPTCHIFCPNKNQRVRERDQVNELQAPELSVHYGDGKRWPPALLWCRYCFLCHKVCCKPTYTKPYLNSLPIQQACCTFHTGTQGWCSVWSLEPSYRVGVPRRHFQAEQLHWSADLPEGCPVWLKARFSHFPSLWLVDVQTHQQGAVCGPSFLRLVKNNLGLKAIQLTPGWRNTSDISI
jgi:hypothetical protein